ncbi:MAG: polyphosphate polymerase domain-containing protein [Patescibacteria group bacterium]
MSKTYRFEFKYELNPKQAYFIEKDIKRFGMKPDLNIISGDGEYFVTSLYYDSYDLSDYQDKAGGFLKRKKFRVRIYEPHLDKSSFVWVEIKNRFGSQNLKTRIKLSRLEFDQFLKNGARTLLLKKWDNGELAKKNEILWNFIKSSVKPKVLVRYKRKAFVDDLENIRITFDSDLETCKKLDFNYTAWMVPVSPRKLVVEVKYDYIMPYWFRALVEKYDLKADTYSKYEKSLEVLHRYNPLLR